MSTPRALDRPIAVWLLVCCALVLAMVVVGGATRLTRSGLSIVEWKPVTGVLPPLSEAAWQSEFAKYRLTPEYLQVNRGMSLEDFKGIFWWEYVHRLLGRLIGIVYLLPLIWFIAARGLRGSLPWKLAGIFLLGALQGGMGWFMVKSGLVDEPRVSQLRLTAHLGLAFAIFAAMFWLALDLLRAPPRQPAGLPGSMRFASVVPWLVFGMVLTGGLVAGTRSGYAYNTFPLMNGHFVPPEILMLEPWYTNFFNNMAMIQFNHRLFAWLLIVAVPALWVASRRRDTPAPVRSAASALLGVLAVQVGLGVSTLLARVPVLLGTAHQGTAVLVLAASLWLAHEVRRARLAGGTPAEGPAFSAG